MEELLVDMLREINYFNNKLAEVNRKLNVINSKYEELATDVRSLMTQSLNSPNIADNGETTVVNIYDVPPEVPSVRSREDSSRGDSSRGDSSRDEAAGRDGGTSRDGGPSRDEAAGRDSGTSRDDGPSRDEAAGRDSGTRRDDGPSRDEAAGRDGGTSRDDGPSRDEAAGKDGDTSRDDAPSKVDTFEEFSGGTTLHGLRFIGDRTSILPRRFFWLLLVMLCVSLVFVQVADRFEHFMSSPSNVKFEVNYPEKITFPAVTFCNQNNFRISKAYEGGWQYFLTDYYQNKDTRPVSSEPHLNTSLTKMFEGLAHTKEDFIVKCQWADEECSAANFTTTLTTNGVCFTFNKVERQQDSLTVQASGVAHALRLTLNTENYERLKGPLDTTGIKMLMTDQNEVPRVEEIGTALSTGVHAFVGISVLTLNNLPPPHGECGEVPLVTIGGYNQPTCLMECETWYAYSTCGCRHFYMPDLTGEMPVCSVEQFLTCLQHALNIFNGIRSTACTCPVSCLYNIYEPTVSYATSSHLKDNVKNDGANVTLVKQRFFASKEISSKIEETLHGAFNATLVSTVEKVERISERLQNRTHTYTQIENGLMAYMFKAIEDALGQYVTRYGMQLRLLKDQLKPYRDRIEENTLQFVCHDYIGYIGEVQDKIDHLVLHGQGGLSLASKRLYLRSLITSLRKKQVTLARALDDFEQLVIDYKQEIILTFSDSFWAEFEMVLVKQRQDILNINESVSGIKKYVSDVLDETAGPTDYNRIEVLSIEFRNACMLFMVDKTMFYSMFIDGLIQSLGEKTRDATAWVVNIDTRRVEINFIVVLINSMTKKVTDSAIPSLVDELLHIQRYLNDSLPVLTKYNIAGEKSLELKLNDIEAIFGNIESYVSVDIWVGTKTAIEAFRLWICTLGDYNCENILSSLQAHINTTSMESRKLLLRSPDDSLALQNVASIVNDLHEYHDEHDMDEEFYRRNFLHVDVYFKELRTDEITQQIDYDEISLLCDIGGATGLFIGGSVMTVFEIVEFLLMCLVCKVCCKKARRCNCKVAPSD